MEKKKAEESFAKKEDDQYKLYKLIWERFIASQMESADLATLTVDFDCRGYLFRTSGYTVTFQGYMAVYEESADDGHRAPMADEPEEQRDLRIVQLVFLYLFVECIHIALRAAAQDRIIWELTESVFCTDVYGRCSFKCSAGYYFTDRADPDHHYGIKTCKSDGLGAITG